jgi:hypothetical protein
MAPRAAVVPAIAAVTDTASAPIAWAINVLPSLACPLYVIRFGKRGSTACGVEICMSLEMKTKCVLTVLETIPYVITAVGRHVWGLYDGETFVSYFPRKWKKVERTLDVRLPLGSADVSEATAATATKTLAKYMIR